MENVKHLHMIVYYALVCATQCYETATCLLRQFLYAYLIYFILYFVFIYLSGVHRYNTRSTYSQHEITTKIYRPYLKFSNKIQDMYYFTIHIICSTLMLTLQSIFYKEPLNKKRTADRSHKTYLTQNERRTNSSL